TEGGAESAPRPKTPFCEAALVVCRSIGSAAARRFEEKMKMRLLWALDAIRFGALFCFVIGAAQMAVAQTQSGTEPEQAGPYGSLLIRDVTVIDGSGAPAFGPADVFVKGNRIVRVVPSDAISREESKAEAAHDAKPAAPDRVIDGKGMFLTPGLIDAHAHINESKDVPAEYIYKLYLGHGVTTVRTFNVGNDSPRKWWR